MIYALAALASSMSRAMRRSTLFQAATPLVPAFFARRLDIHVTVYEVYVAGRVCTSRSDMYTGTARTNIKPS